MNLIDSITVDDPIWPTFTQVYQVSFAVLDAAIAAALEHLVVQYDDTPYSRAQANPSLVAYSFTWFRDEIFGTIRLREFEGNRREVQISPPPRAAIAQLYQRLRPKYDFSRYPRFTADTVKLMNWLEEHARVTYKLMTDFKRSQYEWRAREFFSLLNEDINRQVMPRNDNVASKEALDDLVSALQLQQQFADHPPWHLDAVEEFRAGRSHREIAERHKVSFKTVQGVIGQARKVAPGYVPLRQPSKQRKINDT